MNGFHVGEYIEDELEARGWNTGDLAVRMTDDHQEQCIMWCAVDMVIAMAHADEACDVSLGKKTADGLAKAFGSSACTWERIDRAWRIANGFEKPEG